MATLSINFTPASPVPSLGYKVLYRKVGDASYTTLTPNWTGPSPVLIGGLSNTQYEGTIQSECSSGFFSTPVAFTTNLAYNYTLSPSYNVSITSVTGSGVPSLPPTGVSGNVFANHTGISGTISITLGGALVVGTSIVVTKNSVTFFCAPVTTIPSTFNVPITATVNDVIFIGPIIGGC